jgi:hypothetical protein
VINNLEDVILLLSDEELLKDNAISREEFTLDNLLRMLDMKEELYSFLYLSQLEGGLFSFRERIRNTKRYESYIERIDLFLNSVLNENSIQDIKNLLLEIKENEFVAKRKNNIVINVFYETFRSCSYSSRFST